MRLCKRLASIDLERLCKIAWGSALLFRYLHDDAFLAFSREHKHLYSLILLDLYERFFSGAPAFPTPQEATHAIYDVMGANPALWNENDDFGEPLPEIVSAGRRRIKRATATKTEMADRALLVARQLYQRLVAWGWLEEEEYGLRVTVDMSMGPLLVIQRLASLNKDVSQRFGGLIVTVRLNLEAVEKLTPEIVDRKQREVALALREARNQVDQFTKSLRAILSDLKRIRRTVMESKTIGDRLEAFFEEFVEQLLLRDFESILTFNHPYRFRDAIVDIARRIAHTPATMQVLSEEYVAAKISPSLSEAILDVEGDLLAIESTFGQIGEMFERIEAFRRQLEARVRNTIKYAERGTRGLAGRAGDMVRRLDGLIAQGKHQNARIEWSLEPLRSPWSEFHHAPAREPRKFSTKAADIADDERIQIERRVRQALGDYFDRFGVVSQVGTESEPLREVRPWMQALIHEMEENELRRYERQAKEAADKAATLLRGGIHQCADLTDQ